MLSSLTVFAFAALATGGAAYWVLRAYQREGGKRAGASMIVCVVAALISLGVYMLNGRPELPDAPFTARLEALKQREPTSYTADEALAVLSAATREAPGDPLPYLYSGEVLLSQGRAPEAARAFDAALRREPNLAEAMLGLGRAMVRMEGHVTPEALALFQRVTPLTEDPAPLIYQAMAAMESNNEAEARRFWGEAYGRMGEADPRREMARRMSQGLEDVSAAP